MQRLAQNGVGLKNPIVRDKAGNFAHFEDPDGNEIYFWEPGPASMPESELAHTGSQERA